MSVKYIELTLDDPNEEWRHEENPSCFICAEKLEYYFDIPKNVRTIWIKFSNNQTPESYECRLRHHHVEVIDSKGDVEVFFVMNQMYFFVKHLIGLDFYAAVEYEYE